MSGGEGRGSTAYDERWRGHPAQGADLSVPALRSPAWLKLKPKLTLEVAATGGSAARMRWGDWGEAVMLAFRYTHPRTGAPVEIRQAVRVPRDLPFDVTREARLAVVCWGVMPSGILRHPLLAAR